MKTELLKVLGMSCDDCIASITHALRIIPGVDDVKVSLHAGEAMIKFNEHLTSVEHLKSAVKAAGYHVDNNEVVAPHDAKSDRCH